MFKTKVLETNVSEHSIKEVEPHTENAALDVFLIHGLDGDINKTWTNEASINWPENWLKPEFNTNVYLVNYPVPAFIMGLTGNGMTIQEHARAIIQMMLNNRLGKRNYVFICHSLGGLLAKEILLQCHKNNGDDYGEILKNAKGVFFIATPHRGSAIANIAQLIPGNAAIVAELGKNAPDLTEMFGAFNVLATEKKIKVQSLYETKMRNGTMIVPKASAISGCVGDDPLPIDEDHITICKPSSQRAQVYGTLCKFIMDLNPSARKKSTHKSTSSASGGGVEEDSFNVLQGVILNSSDHGINKNIIRNHIKRGNLIPTRFFYDTDWCADNWIKFSSLHGNKDELNDILNNDVVSEILLDSYQDNYFSFISIGPGDGRKDNLILDRASVIHGSSEVNIRYYPLDISDVIIRGAVNTVAELSNDRIKIKTRHIHGDISEVVYVKNYLPAGKKMFSILGNTIGNLMKDGDTIGSFKEIMSDGDILFLEVRSREGMEDFVEASESGTVNSHVRKASKFSFGPLETIGWEMKLENFEIKTSTAKKFSDINHTETVVIEYNPANGSKNAKLDKISFYDKAVMDKYLKECGFSIKHSAVTQENLYYFLQT